MGRYINTIYGKKYISNEKEERENAIIVIIGLLFVVGMLLFAN